MKKNYNYILYFCLISFLVINIIYLLPFESFTQSNLGTYGDFVGGILNPFFSFISIWILIFIVIHREEDRAKKSIRTQNNIILNQMRFEVSKELRKEISYNLNDNIVQKLDAMRTNMLTMQLFIFNNTALFKELLNDNFTKNVFNPIEVIIVEYKAAFSLFKNLDNTLDATQKENESRIHSNYSAAIAYFSIVIDEYIVKNIEEDNL